MSKDIQYVCFSALLTSIRSHSVYMIRFPYGRPVWEKQHMWQYSSGPFTVSLTIFSIQTCVLVLKWKLAFRFSPSEGSIKGCLFSDPIDTHYLAFPLFSGHELCLFKSSRYIFKVISYQTGTEEHGLYMLKDHSVLVSANDVQSDVSTLC